MARGQSRAESQLDSMDPRQTILVEDGLSQTPPIEDLPTIKLIPHQDSRSNRPSLSFPATTRVLPHEDCIIRVGRYSERDINPEPAPNAPSAAPVGFKSKVVSRRHCEFWCKQGQWYIKDVKSSSGTFLNHIRLSQPNAESRPFPVNDGDVVQLGIDFRGGEEMIFRCVKIRVECNRGWQKTLNSYNVSTHKHLRNLGKTASDRNSDTASTHSSQECSICLMSIAPCQSLFVAPCSHVWHYKCIRPILNDHKVWPQFMCPNCRAVTDLDAELDEPLGAGLNEDTSLTRAQSIAPNGNVIEEPQVQNAAMASQPSLTNQPELLHSPFTHLSTAAEESSTRANAANEQDPSQPQMHHNTSSDGVGLALTGPSPIGPSARQADFLSPISPQEPLIETEPSDVVRTQTPVIDMLVREGPMTPTNSAGPFVFDGRAGRTMEDNSEEVNTPQPFQLGS